MSPPNPLTQTTPAGRTRCRIRSPRPEKEPEAYIPWLGSQPSTTENRKIPARHRKKPGTPKLTRLRADAALSQPERGFQAARTPSGRAMPTASSTPVPVSSRDGTTRWAIRAETGFPLA